MKKLMIAASAVALAATTFGSFCDPVDVKTGCRAYDFKASLKLVDGKYDTQTIKDCFGGSGSAVRSVWRVKASRTLKGLFTDCDQCNIAATKKEGVKVDSILLGEKYGYNVADSKQNGAHLYIASSANKYKAIYNASTFFETLENGYNFHVLNIFGGPSFAQSKYVEAFLQINYAELDKQESHLRAYTLFCAGFGARDGVLVKNISGNVAGLANAAMYCGIPAVCFEPCTQLAWQEGTIWWTQGGVAGDPVGLSPFSPAFDAVYGTWSVKYNASKSNLATAEALFNKTFGSNWYTLTWNMFGGETAPAEKDYFPVSITAFKLGAAE